MIAKKNNSMQYLFDFIVPISCTLGTNLNKIIYTSQQFAKSYFHLKVEVTKFSGLATNIDSIEHTHSFKTKVFLLQIVTVFCSYAV